MKHIKNNIPENSAPIYHTVRGLEPRKHFNADLAIQHHRVQYLHIGQSEKVGEPLPYSGPGILEVIVQNTRQRFYLAYISAPVAIIYLLGLISS